MVFKNLFVHVLWTIVASALKGLNEFDCLARIYACNIVLYRLCYHKQIFACVALEGLNLLICLHRQLAVMPLLSLVCL